VGDTYFVHAEGSGAMTTSKQIIDDTQVYMDRLAIKGLDDTVTQDYPNLDFTKLHLVSNDGLQEYIVMYGGYRAYLEVELSDVQSQLKVLEGHFQELYNIYIFKLANQRETEGLKKLTREEIRGACMSQSTELNSLRKEILGEEAKSTRLGGLLNAYKAAYDAVSRIVTLRNLGG